MILVELESGSQRQLASPNELGEAIRRGELGSGSRIYHRAAAQWLPITTHPEFQKIAASPKPPVEPWDRPLPPLARTQWTFFGMESRERVIDDSPAISRSADGAAHGTSSSARDGSATAEGGSDGPDGSAWRRAFGRAIRYFHSRRSS